MIVRRRRQWLIVLASIPVVYFAMAYVLLPALWRHYEREPGLAVLPMVTRTGSGIPGDALNVGLVGSKEDILRAMHAAGWFPADPITLRTSIEIIGSVVLDRPDQDAPVSPLYYQGKKEQLAFEKPDGRSADKRHHVRFWLILEKGTEGRPVWLGSVTFDRGVGLSLGLVVAAILAMKAGFSIWCGGLVVEGNWVTLEALRSRYIRPVRMVDKVKNVMMVAPDVDVDVFRTQIRRMGTQRPRFFLFVSQDDRALALSKAIWGGEPRLGEVDPSQDPYRGEFAQDRIEVFDLTHLKKAGDNAHDRAFEDVTSVVGMIKRRLGTGQQIVDTEPGLTDGL